MGNNVTASLIKKLGCKVYMENLLWRSKVSNILFDGRDHIHTDTF